MSRQMRCQRCGADRPVDAFEGLCPRCLREQDLHGDAPELVAHPDNPGRYEILGEIARGKTSVVLEGRDATFGRALAIKVLREEYRDDPAPLRRFIAEARILGRLQHPGVVPVHELGTLADARPYFSMELVKGRTLASMLDARSDPVKERPRFLSIFVQVCQTIAYAHGRGVVHRDLNPSNVMVGDSGEVRVMSWGMARDLAGPDSNHEPRARPGGADPGEIRAAREGPNADALRAAGALGSPAYIPPEQANGDLDVVDERADVFAMGSILCEILSGRPAYTGRNDSEVLHKARRGDLDGAWASLELSGADDDLRTMVEGCLATAPHDRPRDAAAVAATLTDYQAGLQGRLREAEARAEGQRSAGERELRASRRTSAVIVSFLAIAALVGLGWRWIEHGHAMRSAVVADRVHLALREATRLMGQAQRSSGDPGEWARAVSAAREARGIVGIGGDATLLRQADDLIAAMQAEEARALAEARAAEADRRLLARLDDVRSAWADDPDGTSRDAAYAAAFRDRGLDLEGLPRAEAVSQIRARPDHVAIAIAAAIDEWALLRRDARDDLAGARRLIELAKAADPDPTRGSFRAAMAQDEPEQRQKSLRTHVVKSPLGGLPLASLHLLGRALISAAEPTRAIDVLRRAQMRFPGDPWINHDLARALEGTGRTREAIRYYTAARATRPETSAGLARALESTGYEDEAIDVYYGLIRLRPGAEYQGSLGWLLKKRGREDEANEVFEAGIAQARDAIRGRPDDPAAHVRLGNCLAGKDRCREAIGALREAIRLAPGMANAHLVLGNVMARGGDPDASIAAYREAIRLRPDDAQAHYNLGRVLRSGGDEDGAIEALREAIRLRPDHALSYYHLGNALEAEGDHEGAIDAYRHATRIKPDHVPALKGLGDGLRSRGDLDGAIVAYRHATRLRPDPDLLQKLATLLIARGNYPDAIDAYRHATRIKPDDALASKNLGKALLVTRDYRAAIDAFREAIRLTPDDASSYYHLGTSQRRLGRYGEALVTLRRARAMGLKTSEGELDKEIHDLERKVAMIEKLPAVLRGDEQPADDAERLAFANLLREKGMSATAARLAEEAFRSRPELGDDLTSFARYNAACAAALAGTGRARDDPPPDGSTRAHLRDLALTWLRADLSAIARPIEDGKPADLAGVSKRIEGWRADPDLAGLRDASAIDDLPEAERPAWRAFWADVEGLLARAGAGR